METILDKNKNNNKPNEINKYSNFEINKHSNFESSEDLFFAKMNMLKKLNELSNCGIKIPNNYDLSSNYDDIKYAYEIAKYQNGIIKHEINYSKLVNELIFVGCRMKIFDGIELNYDNDANDNDIEINIEI